MDIKHLSDRQLSRKVVQLIYVGCPRLMQIYLVQTIKHIICFKFALLQGRSSDLTIWLPVVTDVSNNEIEESLRGRWGAITDEYFLQDNYMGSAHSKQLTRQTFCINTHEMYAPKTVFGM